MQMLPCFINPGSRNLCIHFSNHRCPQLNTLFTKYFINISINKYLQLGGSKSNCDFAFWYISMLGSVCIRSPLFKMLYFEITTGK